MLMDQKLHDDYKKNPGTSILRLGPMAHGHNSIEVPKF
jgi:hypothetical protein